MIITRDQHWLQHIQPRDNRYFAARHPWVGLVKQDIFPMVRQDIPVVLPTGPGSLPQALITPAEDSHPFGEHTPRLWEHYPFALTEHVVGLDANDTGKLGTVLQGDPNAPHWLDRTGCRLFDDHGQASDFLDKTLTGLRAVQREVMETQQLIWELHRRRVLTPCEIRHAGQAIQVYRIDTKRLTALVGDSDKVEDLHLLVTAMEIERSQAGIDRRASSRRFTSSI